MKCFLNEFSSLLNFICNSTNDPVILTGDFNVHFENADKPSNDLKNLVEHYGLLQQVDEATHEHGHMLDLVFTNPYELDITLQVQKSYIKTNDPYIKFDHFPITFEIPMTCLRTDQLLPQYRTWRSIKDINSIEFKQTLTEKLLELDNNNNVEGTFCEQLLLYNNCLNTTLDQFAPLQTKRITCNKEHLPKWFDSDFIEERRKRRALEKQWKRLGTSTAHEQYVQQRDYCVYLVFSF